jgi:putative phosphoesterase
MSDTHMPRRSRQLPAAVRDACANADAIAHLGDFTSAELLQTLRKLATTYAVHGNNDDPVLIGGLPLRVDCSLGGHPFVLIHGHVGGRTAVEAARAVASKTEVGSTVLFGHSHMPYCEMFDGRLLFNPGSPTDKRWAPHRSFGVIDVDDTVHPTLIPVD